MGDEMNHQATSFDIFEQHKKVDSIQYKSQMELSLFCYINRGSKGNNEREREIIKEGKNRVGGNVLKMSCIALHSGVYINLIMI